MMPGASVRWVNRLRREEASGQMAGSGRGGRGETGRLERRQSWLLRSELICSSQLLI